MLILREISHIEDSCLYSLPSLESLWIPQDAQEGCALYFLGNFQDKTG